MGVKIKNGSIVVTNGNVDVSGSGVTVGNITTTGGGKIGTSLGDIGGVDFSTAPNNNDVLTMGVSGDITPSSPDDNSRLSGVGDYVTLTMNPTTTDWQTNTTYITTLTSRHGSSGYSGPGTFIEMANVLGGSKTYKARIEEYGDHVIPMDQVLNVYNGNAAQGYYDGNVGSSFDLSPSGLTDINSNSTITIIKDGTYNINFNENFAYIHITNPYAFFVIETSYTGNPGDWDIIAMCKFNENKEYSTSVMGAGDYGPYSQDKIGYHYGPYGISITKEFKPESASSGVLYVRASMKILINTGSTEATVNTSNVWFTANTQFPGALFGFRTFYFQEIEGKVPVHYPVVGDPVDGIKSIARYLQVSRIV